MSGGSAARETWRAPAKINLWLAITGRRPDGYHEIDTAYQAIDLADMVALETAAEDGARCRVTGDWAVGVPAGDDNLAARAARLLAERTGHDLKVAIEVEKRVPSGAGLGGGSSDAAAVLLALARRFAVPDPEHTLHALAAELGADVPFFLTGGTRRARGVGDLLEPLRTPAERWGILVYPGVPVTTAWAYRAWDESGGAPAEREEPTRSRAGDLPGDWRDRGNALEPVVFARHPEVARAAAILGGGSAAPVRMTGSGSAVFALYRDERSRDEDRERVERAARSLPGARVWPFAFADGPARSDGVSPGDGGIFDPSRVPGG